MGSELSDRSQEEAWRMVYGECLGLGMETKGKSGVKAVIDFIRDLAKLSAPRLPKPKIEPGDWVCVCTDCKIGEVLAVCDDGLIDIGGQCFSPSAVLEVRKK